MPPEWYIDTNGQVEGPLPLTQLCERASAGLLLPTDRVSSDGVNWAPAATVLEVTFSPPDTHPNQETITSPRGDRAVPVAGVPNSQLTNVPGYEIRGKLGAGACGIVFRAVQLKLNRVVALKTVRMTGTTSPGVVSRFEQEAVSLARLQHPNIVAVHDCGYADGQAFFAMELLDGEDLKQRLERTGPLDERTAWLIARQTAAALSHAAGAGVIHRDVKPANLFLVSAPTGFPLPTGVPMVKVTDFGLALTRGGPDASEQNRTADGVLLGTPVYMAPEQFASSDVDLRADIYSLGATVYHILSGQPPFQGRTVWELMGKKAAPAAPLPLPISSATADLVAALMATDAYKRPADYADLIARIDALPCLAGLLGSAGLLSPVPEVSPVGTSPQLSRKRKYMWWAFGLLVAVVGVTVLWGIFKPQPAPTKKDAKYVVGSQELLFGKGSLLGWVPQDGRWEIDKDSDIEQTMVLTGTGGVKKEFLRPCANSRVIITLDPHKADAVEVVIATSAEQTDLAIHWLVRLDRKGGAAFGKRVGTAGAFEPVGGAVAIPSGEELLNQGRRVYVEVMYERAGGTLAAWFRGKPLGRTPDDGLKMSEIQLHAIGGPIRIDFASLEELVEQK